jgi:hypothetical protein
MWNILWINIGGVIDLTIILIIFIVILMVICGILLYFRVIAKKPDQTSDETIKSIPPFHNHSDLNPLDAPSEFQKIVELIKNGFYPSASTEEECEQQLMQFLNKHYPGRPIKIGHTRTGRRIDMVFEGTYAFELVHVTSEGKLIALTDQLGSSKKDFQNIIVILVDIDEVPLNKLNDYIKIFKDIGIVSIIKKGY